MNTIDLRKLKTIKVKEPESYVYQLKCVETTIKGHGGDLVYRSAFVRDGVKLEWDEIHIEKALRHRSHATEFNWGCESPGCKMLALAFCIHVGGALWAINNYMPIATKYIYTMKCEVISYQTIIVTI